MSRKPVRCVDWSSIHYRMYNYNETDAVCAILSSIVTSVRRGGRRNDEVYNDVIVSADTETSKTRHDLYESGQYVPHDNIVVAWTISIRCKGHNICTIYGAKPSQFVDCLLRLHVAMPADRTIVFFHFLSYDYTFLERHMFDVYGKPIKQLITKAHYPVSVEFENGIILRDSLIIAQKTLERWASELGVSDQKAVGKWDYDALRDQAGIFTQDELEYIEHDTLALVECLDMMREHLHKHVYSIPITCTSIIREVVRSEGRKHRAHNMFTRIAPDYDLYKKFEQMYHGGYTHNNRFAKGWIFKDVECYDIASSYPTRILIDKMPQGKFRKVDNMPMSTILKYAEESAFCFTLYAVGVELKNPREPMPALQLSKCLTTVNTITDNGRILKAESLSIVLNEIDLKLIRKQYSFKSHICHDVWTTSKGYMPRWLRDLVYKCFAEKTMLKGGDPVSYSLAKAKINSIYGLMCQKSCRDEIVEDYDTGAYTLRQFSDDPVKNQALKDEHDRAEYEKYLESYNSILPYFWGCWITSYAQESLHELGGCVDYENGGIWLYCDTDSVYSTKWNKAKLDAYNANMRTRMLAQGYGAITHNGKEYWCGVAEFDGQYKEFVGLHSKCYAVRKQDGNLKITVAGVPKKGADCLKNDLTNFEDGFVFDGETTGKLTHYYLYRNKAETVDGIEYGNSIDLHACDYVISMPKINDIFDIVGQTENTIQIYGDENVLLQH